MRGAQRVVLLAAAAATVAASSGPAGAQCAMCKAALEGSVDPTSFNRAILVMLAGPYLVMGAFGLLLFRDRVRRAARRLRARLRSAAPGPPR